MAWNVYLHPKFEKDFEEFSEPVQDEIVHLSDLLEEFGPLLTRPWADTLKGSSYANMKELRFNADNGVWRVAFAFDPEQNAILLIAGDKTGTNEKRFYRSLIKKADKLFGEHLEDLKGKP
jgi:hypothetical protein